MKILVTGTAGFIGHFVSLALAKRGDEVVGLDSINDYYDVSLKHARLVEAGFDPEAVNSEEPLFSVKYPKLSFMKMDLADRGALHTLMEQEECDAICHLAAQAGVRYSLDNPYAYIDSNILGTMNILEGARHFGTRHLVYASSSSVYGMNKKIPFATSDSVDHPVSLYAATKKSNELMAHTYSHLFNIPTTGLRFFTVYGPWGRPDMAYFKFTKAIFEGKPIDVYNNGEMMRDFTFIDDIVAGVVRVLDRAPSADSSNEGTVDPSRSNAPYRVYNIGNNQPVKLMDFIATIEKHAQREAVKNFMPMQPGDVPATYADVDDLAADTGYRPDTPLDRGIEAFVQWYKGYYSL